MSGAKGREYACPREGAGRECARVGKRRKGRRATGLGAAASSPSEEVEEPSLEGSFFGGGGTACRFVGGGTGAVAGVLRLVELVGSFFFAGVKVQRT